jgi:TatD family-associated radical SAM protein
LERLDIVLSTSKYLKEATGVKIRINTNGLSDLINGKPTAHLLEGLVDTISISLNAADAKEYMRISRPCFGEQSFAALLKFTKDCKLYIPQVMFTVVDLLSAEQLAACKSLAKELDIPLRIRRYGG